MEYILKYRKNREEWKVFDTFKRYDFAENIAEYLIQYGYTLQIFDSNNNLLLVTHR